MNVALTMALRVQAAIDELVAIKARSPQDIVRERRLHDRLEELFAPFLDQIEAGVQARGIPADEGMAALLLGDVDALEEQLAVILFEETVEVAAAEVGRIERLVGAEVDPAEKSSRSRAALERAAGVTRQVDRLRPFGMDRKLFAAVERLGGRMLTRFTSRTLDALVSAADVGLDPVQLRTTLGEMLEGELTQLSRHSVGDIRNETTTEAERALGVEFHRWVTANDERTRPAHAEVHNEIARVGERFSNGWLRPGGVGCRCRLEPVADQPAAA